MTFSNPTASLQDSGGPPLAAPDAYERLVSLTDPNDPIDALIDSDGDGLPNSYELYYGTDPLVPDSGHVPRLIIKHNPSAPNEYATFRAAFAASAPYSVIEVKDGEYEVKDWAEFPPHPILLMSENWGRSRKAIIRATGKAHVQTTFYIPIADNRTIIRGLHLRLEPSDTSAHKIGFWVGSPTLVNNEPGASPVFDGVTVELSTAYTNNTAFFVRGHAPQPAVFMNCVVAQRYGIARWSRAVYAIDSPPLMFENCTFLGDPDTPVSFGVQLETTSPNFGNAAPVIPVSFVNCLWDAGFNTNALHRAPFRKLEKCPWTAYSVSMKNCILPFAVEDYPAYPAEFFINSATNLFISPVSLAIHGHLRAPLPYVGAPSHLVPFYDFEGQPRDPLAPTIGADEFIPLPPGDFDGDTLDNWDEIILYGTSPYLADSDGDGYPDNIEIANNTDPTRYTDWPATVTVTVTNTYSTTLANFVYASPSPGLPPNPTPAAIIYGSGQVQTLVQTTGGGVWVIVVPDLNGNGIPDPGTEPFYTRHIPCAVSRPRGKGACQGRAVVTPPPDSRRVNKCDSPARDKPLAGGIQ